MKSTKNCGFFEHAVSYSHQVNHEKNRMNTTIGDFKCTMHPASVKAK